MERTDSNKRFISMRKVLGLDFLFLTACGTRCNDVGKLTPSVINPRGVSTLAHLEYEMLLRSYSLDELNGSFLFYLKVIGPFVLIITGI